MRDGYIRTPSLNEEALSIRAPIKSKVELVNLLYGDNCESTVFLAMFSITDAVEALKDFILIDEDDSLTLGESERGWEDQPYLTASEHYNDSYHKTFKYMSIVN